MKYMLVLQFPAGEIADYEKMVDVEEALDKCLHGVAEVDGHDFGSGEMNIFILTDEPQAAFDKARFIVNAAGLLAKFSAAYRLIGSEEHTRLWPTGS